MKKILFALIAFSIVFSSANAQFKGKSRIINHSGDALYVGWNNKLELKNKKINTTNVKVICNQGKVTFEKGLFVLHIPKTKENQKKVAVITFFNVKNDKNTIICRAKYPIKNISGPTVTFGGESKGEVSIDNVKNVTGLSINMDGPKDLNYNITKYKFVYQPKEGPASFYPCSSAKLHKSALNMLKEPKVGDIIICANIYVEVPESGSKQLPGAIVLTVKE
jgi:hypothetical protein